LTGLVEKLAEVKPNRAVLKGAVGEKISRTLKIIPKTNPPFKVLETAVLNGTDIKYSLEEKANFGEKFYELTVENTKQTAGKYYDKITITTDRTEAPPISVTVSGNIRSK
jgi:hypothetical protein